MFEQQCREAITKRLDATSSFKKKLAGIATAEDAQAKGYAPSSGQIGEMSAVIRHWAEHYYGNPDFCELAPPYAARILIQAIEKEITQLNALWSSARLFHFSSADLAEMLEEAKRLVSQHHATMSAARKIS
jgi:hypothetical protein